MWHFSNYSQTFSNTNKSQMCHLILVMFFKQRIIQKHNKQLIVYIIYINWIPFVALSELKERWNELTTEVVVLQLFYLSIINNDHCNIKDSTNLLCNT